MLDTDTKIFITGGSGFIGTNLIHKLIDLGCKNIYNFDKVEPLNKLQNTYWLKGNLLDQDSIGSAIESYMPDIVIHLAARTDTLSNNIVDYKDNTLGTENLLRIIENSKSIQRLIITSTQYVYKSAQFPFPSNDSDYIPHTAYGKSKAITEKMTRNAALQCCWTIVRPVNIWGPWHYRYPNELWKMIKKGYYTHPGKKEVIRTYGYVKNIVHQIISILGTPSEIVDKQTYYLGDLPVDSYVWLNSISKILGKKPIRRLPKFLFYLLAKAGDIFVFTGIKFPIYSLRYRNMIEHYYAPTNLTIKLFGLYNPGLLENIKETIEWIRNEGNDRFPNWNEK